MTRRAWLRLILHGGTFGAVTGITLSMLFEGDAAHSLTTWLVTTIAAGLLAGALAAALLYAFVPAPRPLRRWLAWPTASLAGGGLFFGITLALVWDWRVAVLLASIWAFGWLCFLWRPAMLAGDAEG